MSKISKGEKEHIVFKTTRKEHNDKVIGISTFLLIITLNINKLNSPVKRCRPYDWIITQMFAVCKADQL
jgi:hypothetical protein